MTPFTTGQSRFISSAVATWFYEKLKQEIISKLDANGFPAHLELQDQGRFFVGYYHQRQAFFMGKENRETEEQ